MTAVKVKRPDGDEDGTDTETDTKEIYTEGHKQGVESEGERRKE